MQRFVPAILLFAAFVLSTSLASPTPAFAQAPPCELDDALSRAAAKLLDDPDAPSPTELLKVAREAGATAPIVRAVTVSPRSRRDRRRVRSWVRERREEADAPLLCGEAQDEGRRIVLTAVSAATLELTPRGLVANLASGFRDPAVVVRLGEGEVVHVPVTRQTLSRGVRLPSELDERPGLLQLLATGPTGPRPVAELVINGSAEDVLDSTPGGEDVERRLYDLRRARGASPLRDNRLLSGEAERQAADVCERGRISHQREGVDPEERLRREGIVARAVGETVARGATPGAAMDALVASPSHLMTLAGRRFTDVGIGTSEDDAGRVCLVVLLSSWPRFMGR
ncbi:MAG: CAP domain-containing protein [Deltaproteobacteria bacterium]|nr:CAP domain-containing protein [Deltaproteobacteria bacterium]